MRGARGGPRVPYELPSRHGFAPNDQGSFDGLLSGSQTLRGGQNQFATVAWSAGDSSNFQYGTGFARMARIHGKEGDTYGAYRPDIEMVWMCDATWLKRFPGYGAKIPATVRLMLEAESDVLFETNDGVSVNADSAVDGGVQVIGLVPDESGAYDLEAARAQITPPGSKSYVLSP